MRGTFGSKEPPFKKDVRVTKDNDIVWVNGGELFERFSAIDDHVAALMRQDAERDEAYLEKHTPIFFSQGYRIGELILHRKRMLGTYPDRDLLCLMPRHHVSPVVLAIRVWWRRWFPYDPKKGKA
jgi:hypothetical protein